MTSYKHLSVWVFDSDFLNATYGSFYGYGIHQKIGNLSLPSRTAIWNGDLRDNLYAVGVSTSASLDILKTLSAELMSLPGFSFMADTCFHKLSLSWIIDSKQARYADENDQEWLDYVT